MKSPIDVLIEKLEAEIARREREKHEFVVQTVLRREYRDQSERYTDDAGRIWWRSVSYEEADARAQNDVKELNDEQLTEKFHELYDDFGESSSDWDGWDEEEGHLNGLAEAARWAREVRDYGIYAFDPDHPRNRSAS